MINAGILPDDLVVHQQPAANNGEIVVAPAGDEATVKRLKRQGRSLASAGKPGLSAHRRAGGGSWAKVAAVIRRY